MDCFYLFETKRRNSALAHTRESDMCVRKTRKKMRSSVRGEREKENIVEHFEIQFVAC